MMVTLMVFGLGCLLELSLWLRPAWRYRRPLAYLIIVVTIVGTATLQYQVPLLGGLIIALLSIYRVVNLGRIIENRIQADYLYAVASRASLYLLAAQVIILGSMLVIGRAALPGLSWYGWLVTSQLLCAGVLVWATLRNLKTTLPPALTTKLADADWPTLTVAIPARNETTDLQACLESLITSTYPKLEILVLDDCSPNKRTPEIIRGFAHAGVRFMAGAATPPRWLPKNYAYQQLAAEANGEVILFCGVDARFTPQSLRVLVATLLEKKKTMLSIIPSNGAPPATSLESMLVQPNRYAWELTLPRRLFNRPPILSTCWLITAPALRSFGGLAAVSRSINAERHLALWCAQHDDGYSFLQSNADCGVGSVKSLIAQRKTAIRVRYPQLRRRIELTALVSVLELLVLVVPFGGLVGALLMQAWGYAALSAATCLLLIVMYDRVVALTYRQFLYRGLWLLPYAALYDIGLLNYSLWKYEFSEVIWKGRNVNLPVMHVVPHLPLDS
ncbi:MAG: glycosyltransferase [Candidatus Saccharibacteria bacterium]